jgi:hypothetical protein
MSAGRSGKPWKRVAEVTASGRTLPACATALAAAIELIQRHLPHAGALESNQSFGATSKRRT